MAGVAESTMAGLGGTFVVAHLQIELALMRPELLLREGPFILVRHLGAQSGPGPFGVLLRQPPQGKE